MKGIKERYKEESLCSSIQRAEEVCPGRGGNSLFIMNNKMKVLIDK